MAAVPTVRPPAARPKSPIRVITAAGSKVVPTVPSTYRERKTYSWQRKAFLYAKIIPELNYASRFYAKMLTKLLIFPATRKTDDTTEPIKEGLPVDLLDRIQDPGGGRSRILASYGRLMFMIGDGFLFGRDLGKPTERWAFVNPDELEITEAGYLWRPTESGEPIKLPKSSTEAYRLWTPSPERSGEAESPMQAGIEIAEELDLLTKAVRATAVSRMLNGMIKVPAELSFGADEVGVDDDPETNPFLQDIIDHITGAIENAGSPEAAAPFLAEGAAEFLKDLVWEEMHNPQNDYLEQNLRKEAIDRLAMGMDLPPEILKGMAEANHWGARQIMHDTWRSHGSVLAEQFCDDLADAYLRPALREAGFKDWDQVVISYDDSNVVVPPDRTDDADKAHDRITISDAAHRKLKGIAEDMAPDEEEQRVRLALKLKDVRLLKGTKFEIEEEPPQEQVANGVPGPDASPDAPPDAQEGPPQPGPAGVSREESRASIVRGAAELALYRCREVAGSRIRQQIRMRSKSAPELVLIDGKSNCHVAATLGQRLLSELGLDKPLAYVKTGADGFMVMLESWGFDSAQSKVLSEMILVWAAKTLYEPEIPSLPPGFLAQVERMRELSMDHAVAEQNDANLARLTEALVGGEIRG